MKQILTLKDWCISLDEYSKVSEKYENKLDTLYGITGNQPDKDIPLVSQCYKKESFYENLAKIIFNQKKKLLIFFGINILVWFFIILFIGNKSSRELADAWSSILLMAVGISILTTCMFCAGCIALLYLKYKQCIKSLDRLEEKLKPFIVTVPTMYRNAAKMSTIAAILYRFPNLQKDTVLEHTDNLLVKLNKKYNYTTLLYDIECECPFLKISDREMTKQLAPEALESIQIVAERKEPTSEYLPKDIYTKVFEGSKDAKKELDSMICLDEIKVQIEKFKKRIQFFGTSTNGCHMGFFGSAGTGKTTVARIVTKILFDLGYIKKNQYIEISGDYLSAGNTSRALAIIEYAFGGVLFIDEAYLMQKNGSEVIGVLLKAMEDHRDDFVVILAGYEEQMTKLFASNEGFSSRVKHIIYFKDYTEQEMVQIFEYFLKDYNGKSYTLSNDAKIELMNIFTFEKRSQNFGNARTVRNAVDAIMDYYADRSIRDHTDTHIIEAEEIQLYTNDRQKVLQHELKNISAVNQLDEQIIRLAELKPKTKFGSENPEEDLQKLIGVERIEKEIELLKQTKAFYGTTPHQKILLIGEHGCGKSTIVKILTGALYKYGYIKNNQFLEISADFLKGSYVGHTTKRAEAIISYAAGGVLYIKNYSMLAGATDDFANEAISIIHTALQDNTDITIIIGDTPSEYIDAIKNQFTIVYEFPKYTEEQLYHIFIRMVFNDGFKITANANTIVKEKISTMTTIYDVQQLYKNIIKNHISNYDGNEETKYMIVSQDI